MFGGTWQQIKDRFVLAAGDSYSVNNTGGTKTVTLRTTDLPNHHHLVNINDPGHSHTVAMIAAWDDGGSGNVVNGRSNEETLRYGTTRENTGITASATTIRDTSNNSFNQTSVDILPPYVVKYCWERIA